MGRPTDDELEAMAARLDQSDANEYSYDNDKDDAAAMLRACKGGAGVSGLGSTLRGWTLDEVRLMPERALGVLHHIADICDACDEPAPDARQERWQPIETAPKDGQTILVCLPRMMNLIVRASYSTVHKYWRTDCETNGGITSPTFFHYGDFWRPMPAPPRLAEKGPTDAA